MTAPAEHAEPAHPQRKRLPLYMRVLAGVVVGALLGVVFGERRWLFGIGNAELGQLGMLVVKLLKALAVPLVFFAVLDAFVKTDISAKKGLRFLAICAFNATVALGIGLGILNVFQPGRRMSEALSAMVVANGAPSESAKQLLAQSHKGTLSLVDNLASYVPKSVVEPFAQNGIISVVLLALLGGVALRRARARGVLGAGADTGTLERFISGMNAALIEVLDMVVAAVPLAVLGVVAEVVGKAGLGVFQSLWVFLATVLSGMAIHAFVYYPLAAWVGGRKSPRVYLGRGLDAILTGLSTNSSLATMPITLKALSRMGVSRDSSLLAACVGTNLNNDGILLYEAMTAIFMSQALGHTLGLGAQVTIALASVMAAAGVAGIPEAGLVVLPLVLGAAGLPEHVIAAAIPMVMTVDWLIARCRSVVNVMSDMLVAVLLDGRGAGADTGEPRAEAQGAAQPQGRG